MANNGDRVKGILGSLGQRLRRDTGEVVLIGEGFCLIRSKHDRNPIFYHGDPMDLEVVEQEGEEQ